MVGEGEGVEERVREGEGVPVADSDGSGEGGGEGVAEGVAEAAPYTSLRMLTLLGMPGEYQPLSISATYSVPVLLAAILMTYPNCAAVPKPFITPDFSPAINV